MQILNRVYNLVVNNYSEIEIMNDLFESRKTAIVSGQALQYDTKELYKVEGCDQWNVEMWYAGQEYPSIHRFNSEQEARECLNAMNGRDVSK